MTTKVLSGHYPNGYAAAATLQGVNVTAAGVVEGSGLSAASGLTLTNSGKIAGGGGAAGTYAYYGVPGGAGNNGVTLDEVSRVTNDGVIGGGVGGAGGNGASGGGGRGGAGGSGGVGIDMQQGGVLVNRSKVTGGAGGVGGYGYISGGAAGAGAAAVLLGASTTITNSGLMRGGAGGLGGFGFYGAGASAGGGDGLQGAAGTFLLRNSGTVVGGEAARAGTYGGAGVDLAAGSVVNTGLLRGGRGSATPAYYGGGGGVGVVLHGSGAVSNGIGGTITGGFGGAGLFGYQGQYFYYAAHSGDTGGDGVALLGGGSLSNRSVIAGGAGGAGGFTDSPFATYGAAAGGQGGVGVVLDAIGSVLNTGTIRGGHGGVGGAVEFGTGSSAGSGGVGGAGVVLDAVATVTNLGSIIGGAGGAPGSFVAGNSPGAVGAQGIGVGLTSGGEVVNGSRHDSTALISGSIGVSVAGAAAATVVDYGVIRGSTAAVQFASSADRLIAMSGAVFMGGVKGGGGTLELDGGTGSVSGIGGGGVLSGDDQGSFSGFATYEFDAGGHWTAGVVNLVGGDLARSAGALMVDGDVTLAAGSQLDESKAGVIRIGAGNTITNAGLIEAGGSGKIVIQDGVNNTGKLVTEGGDLTIGGAVTGAGSAAIEGGVLRIDGAFSEKVAFFGADPSGTLALRHATAYGGKVIGFSTDGKTALDLLDVGFTSAGEASFSGTSTGGVLTVSDGTNTAKIKLKGDFVGDTFTAKSDGSGGVIVTASDSGASAAAARLVQAMASFGAGADPPTAFQASLEPVRADALIAASMLRTVSNGAASS